MGHPGPSLRTEIWRGICFLVGLPVEGPTLKMQSGRRRLPQIANWVLQRMRPVPATKIITEDCNNMVYQHETSLLHKP